MGTFIVEVAGILVTCGFLVALYMLAARLRSLGRPQRGPGLPPISDYIIAWPGWREWMLLFGDGHRKLGDAKVSALVRAIRVLFVLTLLFVAVGTYEGFYARQKVDRLGDHTHRAQRPN